MNSPIMRRRVAERLAPRLILAQRFLETTHIRWHDRGASFDKLRMRVARHGTKIVPQPELVEGRTALIPATARKLGIAVLATGLALIAGCAQIQQDDRMDQNTVILGEAPPDLVPPDLARRGGFGLFFNGDFEFPADVHF